MKETEVEKQGWIESIKTWNKSHSQVYHLVIPVFANLMLTLAAWIFVYEMKIDKSPVSLLFLDSAHSLTTGSDFYDGLLNGLVCVVSVAVLSFIMLGFALFNFRRLIQCWLSLSCLLIMFCVSGSFFNKLLGKFDIHNGFLALAFTLIYGITGIYVFFTKKLPLGFHQFYVICNCSLVSLFYLQILPNHTTWFLLAGIVMWDIFAVLTPLGPLRQITGKAQDYSEEILKFLMFTTTVEETEDGTHIETTKEIIIENSSTKEVKILKTAKKYISVEEHSEFEDASSDEEERREVGGEEATEVFDEATEVFDEATEVFDEVTEVFDEEERQIAGNEVTEVLEEERQEAGHEITEVLEESIVYKKSAQDALNDSSARLGMGDFVFYSLLVGKAAVSGSVFATMGAIIGVLVGLIVTLTVLSDGDETTPALPVSIFLGTTFHFAILLVIEPLLQYAFNEIISLSCSYYC